MLHIVLREHACKSWPASQTGRLDRSAEYGQVIALQCIPNDVLGHLVRFIRCNRKLYKYTWILGNIATRRGLEGLQILHWKPFTKESRNIVQKLPGRSFDGQIVDRRPVILHHRDPNLVVRRLVDVNQEMLATILEVDVCEVDSKVVVKVAQRVINEVDELLLRRRSSKNQVRDCHL